MTIKTVQQFKDALAGGRYSWPGGYPLYFVTKDGGALSYMAARDNDSWICDAITNGDDPQWEVVGIDINFENTELHCDHTGEQIESAYGDDEKETRQKDDEEMEKELKSKLGEGIDELANPNDKIPFKRRLGRCYELAGRLATHNEDTVLVHGSIEGLGNPRIDHAWVELMDGSVWEPASNKIWSKDAFDRLFNPKENQRYTYWDAMKAMAHASHWGPWDWRPPTRGS